MLNGTPKSFTFLFPMWHAGGMNPQTRERHRKEKKMKQDHHITLTGTTTTPTDIGGWVQALFRLHARIAPHFVRPEPRRRALLYLQGPRDAQRDVRCSE